MFNPAPVLSICVPTYNRRAMLERNIQFHLSAFRSMGIPFEIVVVDDCSTDGTHEYLESLSGVPELSHFRRVRNSGFLSNYAFAMQQARGKYALFLGDDDLLIPEQVAEYIGILESEPDLGMIQAPWMLVNERQGGVDMGPFYHLPGPARFRKGEFRRMLDFILDNHVFPEFLIIRRDILDHTISSLGPFIFWAFLYTTRALARADVLFLPKPFARVTGVSHDPRPQQGNKECMFQWDTYLGGLEYLASRANALAPPQPYEQAALLEKMRNFMQLRKSVALKLHMASQYWVEAYFMYHRIAAYGPPPMEEATYKQICMLAAMVTALKEAAGFSGDKVIVDPMINDEALGLLPDELRSLVVRQPPLDATGPRAWMIMTPQFAQHAAPQDGLYLLSHYVSQFE